MTAEQGDGSLLSLPGVRRQLDSMAADLAAGLNCLWLLPDHLVDTGHAEELYRAALHSAPDRLDIRPPEVLPVPAPRRPEAGEAGPRASLDDGERAWGRGVEEVWEGDDAWDSLPDLDFDDGFDIGWTEAAPVPARSLPLEHAMPELFERLGKELAVSPTEVIERLAVRGSRWRPVVGLRAWCETEETASEPAGAPASGRGSAIERLLRSLTAAVKEAGLSPQERPRLLIVARLRDLPVSLVNELDRDIATTAVHWWWGTVGRLDTALVVEAAKPPTSSGTLERRILMTVREETIAELASFDLVLARRLTMEWDGTTHRLDAVLRSCVDSLPTADARACPEVSFGRGTPRRPGSSLRQAWARGVVQSWEGRLRHHPARWYAIGAQGEPPELSVAVGQAQQRVVLPWIEDAREQLARLGLGYATRPLGVVVADFSARPPADLGNCAQQAFLELEVGSLLAAYHGDGIAFPAEELKLLKLLVKARNILSHRGALRDYTLRALCDELTSAHRRWAKL
ncbi:hypothetical protein GTW40_27900 [Streptomyces sp. SID4985]|uniref:hypothetical protein n=1 Tax=Streptomyces sp. SID4985 TaxID=2690292 RepID=UPI001370C2BB|nr:hypothetical protein [Streptomyces sp. SID4985]MYQ48810.1 hypothetical protein [Streptomyces sp. SID4985]